MKFDEIPSPSGLTIFHRGPPLTRKPLPTLFYFALSGGDSLHLDPYNQPAAMLSDVPIHVFSFTLPFHGPGFVNTEAMSYWSREISQNNNFIDTFVEQSIQNIHFLIDQQYIDPKKMAVAGLSRGSLIAAHLAAKEPLLKIILGYAPLTEPAWMEDFKELRKYPITALLPLNNLVDKLYDRKLRFYIGNRDLRVSTEHCFQFIKNLTEAAFQKGIRSPQTELIIYPSVGHKGHGTPPHIFKSGIEWIKAQFDLS